MKALFQASFPHGQSFLLASLVDQAPLVQKAHPVGHLLGLGHDVGGVEDGVPQVPVGLHEVQEGPPGEDIQTRGGLVQEEDRGAVEDGPGDDHLLPHARGHLQDLFLQGLLHLQKGHHPVQGLLKGAALEAVEGGEEGQDLPPREAVVDPHPSIHQAQAAADFQGLLPHVKPRHLRPSRRGTHQGGEHPQRGGLARPVGAKEGVDLSPLYLQG
jgi:hypothetical protein